MLPSVRRAVSVACSAQGSLPKAAASAVASGTLSVPSWPLAQQRRYSSSSSSKPSSKPSPTRQPVPKAPAKTPAGSGEASDASAASRAAAGVGGEAGDKPKPRKAKQPKLPSVPSTQHIPPEFIGLSAFFSMHRPISVTQSLPKSISDEAFASIFSVKPASSRKKQRQVSDVIATLSQAVDNLEGPMAQLVVHEDDGSDGQGGMRKVDIKYASGDKTRMLVDVGSAASAQFLPYHPPPLPVPQRAAAAEEGDASAAADSLEADLEAEEAESEMEAQEQTSHQRKYRAIITVEEMTDADGQLVSAVVRGPQILHEGEGVPRTFLERMALRQLRSRLRAARVRDEAMHAISVKRQKKLKMKKKKYKKLQKRLRLENRKLDKK